MSLREYLRACRTGRVLQSLRYLVHVNLPNATAGMITMNERDFYSRCASKYSEEGGVIVDLGCWMGATTTALARGISKKGKVSSKGKAVIYAFDRFLWETWMDRWRTDLRCDYLPGECFLPEVRRNLEQFTDIVRLTKADLTTYSWDGDPIEVLLVDAMKNKELAHNIASEFFPSLSPGSILIHQDFKHFYTPWIHILQYRLREHFCLLENVSASGTLAFETNQEISREQVEAATDFQEVSDEEVEEAFAYSHDLVGEEGKEAVAAAHIMHFFHAKRKKKAQEVFSQYRSDRVRVVGDLKVAKQNIDQLD